MPVKKTVFRTISLRNRKSVAQFVSSRLSWLYENGTSPDYYLLKTVFLNAEHKFLTLRSGAGKSCRSSCQTLLLQKQFHNAIKNVLRKKTFFSVFVGEHLEKLLYAQHKTDRDADFKNWLAKMNNLDFQRRTRMFFSEVRRKYRPTELFGPIQNSSGSLSRNLTETLKNWSDFYSKLYTDRELQFSYETPDDDPELDKELTHAEFLECIYALKHHKAPGSDHITSEDITCLIPHDSEDDHIDQEKEISSLHFIFKILSD